MEGTYPVNKKLIAAMSGGAALVLALSGCSDDDNKDEKVDAWAKAFCDSAKPQLKQVLDAFGEIQAVSDVQEPKKYQQVHSAGYQKISEGYAALAEAFQKAGVPPVDGGEKSQAEAVKGLNSASKSYAELKTAFDELNTEDKGEFAAGLAAIKNKPEKIAETASPAMKKLESGELGAAIAEQPGCKKVSDAPSPSAA